MALFYREDWFTYSLCFAKMNVQTMGKYKSSFKTDLVQLQYHSDNFSVTVQMSISRTRNGASTPITGFFQ